MREAILSPVYQDGLYLPELSARIDTGTFCEQLQIDTMHPGAISISKHCAGVSGLTHSNVCLGIFFSHRSVSRYRRIAVRPARGNRGFRAAASPNFLRAACDGVRIDCGHLDAGCRRVMADDLARTFALDGLADPDRSESALFSPRADRRCACGHSR